MFVFARGTGGGNVMQARIVLRVATVIAIVVLLAMMLIANS